MSLVAGLIVGYIVVFGIGMACALILCRSASDGDEDLQRQMWDAAQRANTDARSLYRHHHDPRNGIQLLGAPEDES